MTVYRYSYKPTIAFWLKTEGGKIEPVHRTPAQCAGVELELVTHSPDALAELADEIAARVSHGRHVPNSEPDPMMIWAKWDSSVCGVEIVTAPMSADAHAMFWGEFLPEAKSRGRVAGWRHQTAGLHVHVDKPGSDLERLKMAFFIHSHPEQFRRIARRDPKKWGRLCRKKIIDYQINNDRYEAVNYFPSYTAEFRLFRASLRPDTITGTVELCLALRRWTVIQPIMQLVKTRSAWNDFRAYCENNRPYAAALITRLVKKEKEA